MRGNKINKITVVEFHWVPTFNVPEIPWSELNDGSYNGPLQVNRDSSKTL